jgi:HEAT repeat protein
MDPTRPPGVVDIPETPADVPYAEREDTIAERLLELNGLPTEGAGLRGLLDASSPIVVSAAARRLGVLGVRDALPRLRELARSPNDLLAVHAATGLARLDRGEGAAALRELTRLPVEACPGAIQAAGELARLGDLGGADAVGRALASENPVVRTIGAKQLLFLAEAGDDDAVQRLGALLEDPDPGIPWIALSQLAALRHPRAREHLAAQAERGSDAALRDAARRALSTGPAAPP